MTSMIFLSLSCSPRRTAVSLTALASHIIPLTRCSSPRCVSCSEHTCLAGSITPQDARQCLTVGPAGRTPRMSASQVVNVCSMMTARKQHAKQQVMACRSSVLVTLFRLSARGCPHCHQYPLPFRLPCVLRSLRHAGSSRRIGSQY